jgi:signal transduction histidine kinase
MTATPEARHNRGMPWSTGLAELIAKLTTESDSDAALNLIAQAARVHTSSRNVIIAVLNEYMGHLEIRSALHDEVRAGEQLAKLALKVGDQEGIVGYVAATGSTVMTGNVLSEPNYRRLFESTISEIAVPIRDRNGRVRAVISAGTDRQDAYGEKDSEVLQVLADLSSLVLQQEQYVSHEEALIQIGSSLREVTEEALLEHVINVAKDVLRLQACSIFLEDPLTDSFVLRGTVGWAKEQIGVIRYGRGEGFTGWVADTGQPILLTEPQTDPRWRGKYVEIPSNEIASFLAVPIIVRKRSIGAIRVLRRKTENRFLDNRFTPEDLRLLEAIAEQVAAGLENSRNVESVIRNERMIAWGELSAKSSHMIGNRVFALKGDVNELGHMLDDNPAPVEEIKAIQQSLVTNVTRIEEILQDFRDFVSATQIDRRPTDLNALLKETIAEVFPKRSGIELELKLDPELPRASADPKRLRRAISELIENSINQMETGTLTVATREAAKGKEGRTMLEIEMSDTGPGVDADQKTLIFQPFFSKRVKGMGLGLSIVKGIVDAHGGEVYESGQDGEGARFIIHLPPAVRDEPGTGL